MLAWMMVGSGMGWLASAVMKVKVEYLLLLHVVVGTLGATIGARFLTPLLGIASNNPNGFSVTAMAMSVLGAGLLLALISALRRTPALLS